MRDPPDGTLMDSQASERFYEEVGHQGTAVRTPFTDYLWRGWLVLMAVAALYIGGYIFCVGRSVATCAPQYTAEGSRTYHVVSCELGGGWKYRIFSAALKLDREVVRRRYWSGWYVVETATSTKLDYDCDRMRR